MTKVIRRFHKEFHDAGDNNLSSFGSKVFLLLFFYFVITFLSTSNTKDQDLKKLLKRVHILEDGFFEN